MRVIQSTAAKHHDDSGLFADAGMQSKYGPYWIKQQNNFKNDIHRCDSLPMSELELDWVRIQNQSRFGATNQDLTISIDILPWIFATADC